MSMGRREVIPFHLKDIGTAPGGSRTRPLRPANAYPRGEWSSKYSAAMLLESLIRPEATSAGISDAG